MEEHHKDDKSITKKELNKVEKELGRHSKSVVKIFRVGYKHGQQKRALGNATVHQNGQIPVMKGAEKDHKVLDNGVIKMRPIVNAMDGPKKTVSDIFSDVATPVIESMKNDVLCYSTEELLESFERFNKSIQSYEENDSSKYIVGSMDATALYPSLEAEKSAEIVKNAVKRSKVVFENIDMNELGIYLRTNLPQEYIREQGLDELLPIRISGRPKTDSIENNDDVYKYVEHRNSF